MVTRSKSLPVIVPKISLTDCLENSGTSSCESYESLTGKHSVSNHVKKKFRNIVGVLRGKRRPKSRSGGDIPELKGFQERQLNKRQLSLPTEYLPIRLTREYQKYNVKGGNNQHQIEAALQESQNQAQSAKHENIYRGLMHSLLHPLGTPEGTVGLRPGDLLDHLRELELAASNEKAYRVNVEIKLDPPRVFNVEREDHEAFIREELSNRPKNLQVNVNILEANGLRGPDFTEDSCDSFCIIQLHNAAKGKNGSLLSPKHSPRHSPKTSAKSSPNSSPFSSPKFFRKPQLDMLSIPHASQKTSVVRNSSQPKWNEEFPMDIEDFLTDEVHIYIFNQEQPTLESKDDKQNSLKTFLHRSKSSSTDSQDSIGCIGKIIVPVRNISSMGTDEWYDIATLNTEKGKHKPVGKCHLRLGISYKQDTEDSFYFSSEDYYKAFKQFLGYTYCESSRHVEDQYGQLSLKAHRILRMFAEAHGISKLSQAIVNVTCLLEIHCEREGAEMSEHHINTALDDLQMTWATMQIGQKSILDRMPLTDTELSNYRRVASKFILRKCEQLDGLPILFPPTLENLNALKAKLGIIVQLLGLDLLEPNCEPQKQVCKELTDRLQCDVLEWIDCECENISETSPTIKDKVIPEMQRLINLVNTIASHCNVLPVNKHFYNDLGINYYRLVSLALEKKIGFLVRSTIDSMNRYKRRYNSFSVNIMAASKLSLSLYFALRKLCNVVRENVTRRELFRLTLAHYQEWFEESMIYWLQTFRTECINRMGKALEIEKDIVVVTSLVKYSHSSVDVLSCFSQVIEEWKKIDFRDSDCALMGVTKITDIICDGARLYADKVHTILERNCYFDDNLNAEFDINDRLCITLNNIEHVRLYLGELPQLLSWESVTSSLSATHGNDGVGKQAKNTLHRLIDTSNSEILTKSSLLLRQIAEKMRIDLAKYMEIFTRKEPKKPSSVDKFLGYVSTNMQTLNEQLMPDIYPYMIEQLWIVILQILEKQIIVGKRTDYYDQMKQHLRALRSFFQRSGLQDTKLHSYLYHDFKTRLDLNCRKSEDLMLLYMKELSTDMTTPPECYGHLAFKAAYMEETRGNMTIFVTVLRGNDLPGLDSSGFSDPYVEVSLQPQVLFAWSRSQRTHVVKQTLNPVFNVTFQFPNISKEYLNMQGSSILLTVYDYDTIGWDDFAGEVILHIPSLPRIDINNSIDKIPAVIMPLKRPQKPLDGPFAMLSQREWDRTAKSFVADRLRFIERQPTRTDKGNHNEKGIFSSFFSSVFH